VIIKYWCNTHQRRVKDEYPNHSGYACIPASGWIMMPCKVINCEDVGIEITEDNNGRE